MLFKGGVKMNQQQYELIMRAIGYALPAMAEEPQGAFNNLVNAYNELREEIKKEA